MPDEALLSARLPRRPHAISAARRALSALNRDLHLISGARLRDAQLLFSELVTNAVRNGDGQDVRFSVRATARTLRVEVANSGAVFDPAQLPPRSGDQLGGWGLRMVDAVAQRWGVAPEADGACVWFELDRPHSPAALALSGKATPLAGAR